MFSISCAVWSFDKVTKPCINSDPLRMSFFYECAKKIKSLVTFRDRLWKPFALPVDFPLSTLDQDDNGVDIRPLTLVYKLAHRLNGITDGRGMCPHSMDLALRLI